MATHLSTGPVALFTGTGTGYAPQYLGSTEGSPKVRVVTADGEVKTDITGEVPLDYMFLGMRMLLSFTLSRWDDTVARLLERKPGPMNTNGLGAVPGVYNVGDIASFYAAEGWTFPIWLRFLFGSGTTAKVAYTAAAGANGGVMLVQGYRLVQARVIDTWEIEVGARPMKRVFQCEAWPKLNVSTGTNPTLTLYDNDMSAVSTLSIA